MSEVVSRQALQEVELSLQGMTCAACAARIEKQLNELDGVEAAVNYATETATVVFAAKVSSSELISAVEAIGYAADIRTAESLDESLDDKLARLWVRLIVCVALSIPVVLISMISALQFDQWQWVAGGISLPVVTWGAWPFHRAALINMRHGAASMDTLISIGVTAATAWSVWALVWGDAGDSEMVGMAAMSNASSHVYFEVAASITAFILMGRFLETRAKFKAGDALRALLTLGAREAVVMRDGVEKTIPASVVRIDDLMVVRPGEKFAADGVVVEGRASIDTSTMTGESVPEEVGPGDSVRGATININGRIVVRATRVGKDTQFANMAKLVRDAQATKAPVQRIADRVSAIFVPVVILISIGTLAAWLWLGDDVAKAFSSAVAVLIIACPCALGLATPTALMVGAGRAAQMGIIIKGVDVLQSTRRIDTVILDKTGTVTTGRMELIDVVCTEGNTREKVLQLAGAVEYASEHPIGKAIARGAVDAGVVLSAVTSFETFIGLGATGVVDGIVVTVGREELLRRNLVIVPAILREALLAARLSGHTAVIVAWSGTAQAVCVVADQPKPTSAQAVVALKKMGLAPVLVSGDNPDTARAIAMQVGIETDDHHLYAGVLPEEKVQIVKDLQARGYAVAMVGDGVNDAAALAQADVGISMGGGTDAAMQASDLTIVSGDLRLVADAIRLSRATLHTIKANVFWAFAYNAAAIPLAAAGAMNPMWAGLAMASSSVFVVTNSLRLRKTHLSR
ncbi:MAG: copper-translocating P-type ATPase [Ilumatobacteraceae bacterium]|nr:copper-translocating P-type ATPase [Ilumatobacteraceae bacterium]MBJ7367884.1 copper-translocating P-type ATPase [Ilumatobacteraceae bacterium]MBJ7488417.1 copper-translocating P-type ATPase [Ilumatobacteraceae bacterium]